MKRLILSMVALLSLSFVATPALVSAQGATPATNDAKGAVCEGLGQINGGGSACDPNAPQSTTVGDTIKTAISILSFVVGIVAVVMIIIGGFKYIVAGGDSSRTANAKDTILYAIIGLVVAALAQIIVQFVLEKLP